MAEAPYVVEGGFINEASSTGAALRKISGPQRACIMQTREETNTEASVLNTPLAVPLTFAFEPI